MTPEQKARKGIDRQLDSAGWVIQDYRAISLGAGPGIAVREVPLEAGPADHVLFVDRQAVGVVEAKPAGTTLSGVAEQSTKYVVGVPEHIPHIQEPLPFAYEGTGVETRFRDLRDPHPASRPVFSYHRPETLREWVSQEDTLRRRLQQMPPLDEEGLWACQVDALRGLGESLADARQRALIQMATGSGKTFTAVTFIYRLIKFAKAKRILFLVDRNNLGRQTRREFQQYRTPDDGRIFTELYNVQHLSSNTLDSVSNVCITTIQRLYSMLQGEEIDEALEEHSLFDIAPVEERPREVVYNPRLPIETFDFIVTDECHRSIYNLWRQVLEYFDAFLIGLTATPSKQTLGFFNQNLVTEYSHEKAVADGVNVGYDVYRIKTDITESGATVEAGFYVDRRDRQTREVRWEQLDEEFTYTSKQLDRDVVAKDQIRTVIKTFKDKLLTEIFPGRVETPKTLIFAKDDSHAEDIVEIVRDEFARGNDFCKKITYRTTGEKPEDLIRDFRNSPMPRIAVTVDMVSTGTDIRPLECLIFMRDVKSRTYFEQMKGRGTRTISPTDLEAVTPGARHKTHFVIVDAVGVCESDKTDSRPLERKPGISFEKLLQRIALGNRDEDSLASLASRLSRTEKTLTPKQHREIKGRAGTSLRSMVSELLDAVDPDTQRERAQQDSGVEEPGEEQLAQAARKLADEACAPFDDPEVRDLLVDIRRQNEQTIDTVTKDTVTFAGFDEQAKERAKSVVDTFKQFIEDNKDELTALQIIYSRPHGQRHVTYEQIQQLADAIEKPPYHLASEEVWAAYEQLEKSKVRGAGPQKMLTDIISLVRFAVGEDAVLEPFSQVVEERFGRWLASQVRAFTPEQVAWLRMIKDHLASSLSIEWDDFDNTPFAARGGRVKVYQLFGDELEDILTEMQEVLVA